jgi:WD40 repeat protein
MILVALILSLGLAFFCANRSNFYPSLTIKTPEAISRLAVSSDRTHAVSIHASDDVQFIDLNTEQCGLKRGDICASSVAISPDGSIFVVGGRSGSRAALEIWDLKTPVVRSRLYFGEGLASFTVFDQTGRDLYVGTHGGDGIVDRVDVAGGTLNRVFDAASAVKLPKGSDHEIWSLTIAPAGDQLVIGLANGVVVWDLKTSTERLSIQGTGMANRCAAVSPDEAHLATAGASVIVSDFRTGRPIYEWRLDKRGGSISTLAFSPDGKALVAGVTSGKPFQGYVVVWRTDDYSAETFFPCHSDVFQAMAFLPGTNKLVTGSQDRTVCVWDLDKLRRERCPGPGTLDNQWNMKKIP